MRYSTEAQEKCYEIPKDCCVLPNVSTEIEQEEENIQVIKKKGKP